MLIYAMACASAFVSSPNALTQQRFAQSSIAMQSTAPPSEAIWNEQIKAAWTKAYQTATCPPADYAIEDIVGKIPEALSGTIFRNGPGNFERGSKRYKHVLDGDGLLCRFSLDGLDDTGLLTLDMFWVLFYENYASGKCMYIFMQLCNVFTIYNAGWTTTR